MNRNCAIGCCIVFAVGAILMFALVKATPKIAAAGKRWVQSKLSDMERQEHVEKQWTPPSDSADPDWFPAEVNEWKRASATTIESAPALKLTKPAVQALYKKGQSDEIEVTIVAASKEEEKKITSQIEEGLKNAETRSSKYLDDHVTVTINQTHRTVRFGNRTHFVTNGHHTRIWWVKGWLFVFRDLRSEDPEAFTEPFLKAMPNQKTEDGKQE